MRRRVDPFAGVVEAGVSLDGVDDRVGGRRDALGRLDDVFEGEPEIVRAAGKEAVGVGVAVEAGAAGELELLLDEREGAPLEEGFVDGVAVGMAADGTGTAVVRERNGAGAKLAQRAGALGHLRFLSGALMRKFVPGFDFQSPIWSRFIAFKGFRDSLVHPHQTEDETDPAVYRTQLRAGLGSIIEVMNQISVGVYRKPLRKQLLDLIPE